MPEGVPMGLDEKDLGMEHEEDAVGEEEAKVKIFKKPEEEPEVLETSIAPPAETNIGPVGDAGRVKNGESSRNRSNGSVGKSPDSLGEGLGRAAGKVVGGIAEEGDILGPTVSR